MSYIIGREIDKIPVKLLMNNHEPAVGHMIYVKLIRFRILFTFSHGHFDVESGTFKSKFGALDVAEQYFDVAIQHSFFLFILFRSRLGNV